MNIVLHKVNYYTKWYSSMTREERLSSIGIWVFDRIIIFCSILSDLEEPVNEKIHNGWFHEQILN